MTKQDIVYFRDTLCKGKPMVIICDNEHNFFDNYPGQCFPVWDDDNERVMFLQTNQESAGLQNKDYPYTISITEYEHIQCIKAISDRKDVVNFLETFKDKLGEGKYQHNLELVSKTFQNSRPNHKPYYEQLL